MSVASAILDLKNEIPQGVTLVAVSKTKPNEAVLEAYDCGHRDFGENKVQDICRKREELPDDINWHFIGHLQSNKVKFLTPFVHLIHGVDSMKLIREINKRAIKDERIVDFLLQIDIADEESKFGFSHEEATEIIEGQLLEDYKNINLRGLMGMATNTSDESKIRNEFSQLKKTFDAFVQRLNKNDFNILSMGMTGDYKIAIEEGSNMVRIGSKIFGARV